VPDLDHEQFEGYLKQFQPLAPEALPVEVDRRETRRVPALVMWAAAAAVIVVAVTAGVQHRLTGTHSSSDRPGTTSVPEQIRTEPLLTLRDANAWFLQAPSFKAAVDSMAWRAQTAPISAGKQSALASLGKENFRL